MRHILGEKHSVVNTRLWAWLQLHTCVSAYVCVCVWVEYVAVGCVRELIGGGSCELARDGSSDAANRGGERDRRLPSRRATLYLKTGLKLSELLISFFGGLFINTETGQKKKRERRTSTNTDTLSRDLPQFGTSLKMIPSRSKPLHYSLTSLLSWVCCAFWQFQGFLNN